MGTTLQFAGLTWSVRQSGSGGPGPNNWSPDNVFVDSAGNLHLKLTYQGGQWYAAELYTNASFGFGTYQVQLATPVDKLNQNVVAGFFNYPKDFALDGSNEIDVEFATWGGTQANHGNWTVWPATVGPSQNTRSFAMPSDGGNDTYRFTWTSRSVTFQALTGHVASGGTPYSSWTFAPSSPLSAIGQQPEPFHMNLWLEDGQAPTDGQQVDLVVSGFSFTPLGQSQPIGPSSSAADAVQAYTASPGGPAISVADSAAAILANLDGLESVAISGKLTGITLTDGGIPALQLGAAQLAADRDALGAIGNSFTLLVAQPAAGQSVTGLNGHGSTVQFAGSAAQYAVSPAGDGISFTLAGNGSSNRLSGVTALQFSDTTDFVAATPGPATAPTTGNVTELYGAVFGREPDVPGLAYYQGILKANPALPLTVFAQWFLQSPEYTGNAAHGYAQTAAGDTQFITDAYNNLLHRAPESGAVPYYLAIIAQLTAGQTPGTDAYTSALLLAHATVITDFSQSAEFLGDVQITAGHPADAQHWLFLI